MNTMKATDVRRDWSKIIDSVIREKPAFIRRTRDDLFLSNIAILHSILEAYEFNASKYIEDDGSVTLSLDAIDLVENASTEGEAILKLAESILEYANDYYDNFDYWNRGNRKSHVPYVIRALILNDSQKIGGLLKCHPGKTEN